MRTVFLCLTMAVLSACAPNSTAELRQSSARVTEFQMNESYQSVYRRLTSTARKCFEVNLVTAQRVVRSELYNDLGSAEVSYELFGVNNEVYAVVDISKMGNGALIKVTTAEGWDEYGSVVQRHLNGQC